MNVDKMTREEFDDRISGLLGAGGDKYTTRNNEFWDRINAIQSAPFVPDWSLMPDDESGFLGFWTSNPPPEFSFRPGEFYIPAPSNDEKMQMVGEGVSRNDEPFRPDWSLKPPSARSFRGSWSSLGAKDCTLARGEFVIPAPSNPTDAELSAMWDKLDKDKRVQILREAGVVV